LSQKTGTSFPHRRNPDGTFDSICTECFTTVATEATEAELIYSETAHNCQGFDLGQMLHRTDQERRSKLKGVSNQSAQTEWIGECRISKAPLIRAFCLGRERWTLNEVDSIKLTLPRIRVECSHASRQGETAEQGCRMSAQCRRSRQYETFQSYVGRSSETFKQYAKELESNAELSQTSKTMYTDFAKCFVRWMNGEFKPGCQGSNGRTRRTHMTKIWSGRPLAWPLTAYGLW